MISEVNTTHLNKKETNSNLKLNIFNSKIILSIKDSQIICKLHKVLYPLKKI
ncbi:hypothetical protein C8P70_12340 [Myroides indicus]|uniref:Uncharacterized protein n=1 Tax=Myroides indicus TaxID=1323422 RepID=A0A4R7EZF5_9FLAO|nr:hypothetical protein C8P70_12340 [Myroides indicus]